jgi:hypothetical protein
LDRGSLHSKFIADEFFDATFGAAQAFGGEMTQKKLWWSSGCRRKRRQFSLPTSLWL